MLDIQHLIIHKDATPIVQDFSLSLQSGKTYYILGPNGSGKSTLALSLMGYPEYHVEGTLLWNGQNMLELSVDKRARLGMFLSMQYPPAVKGVTILTLLKNAYQAVHGTVHILEFRKMLLAETERLGLGQEILSRGVNEGFSGGERKRLELLQLSVLKPKLAILDEPDSGLDVDGIQLLSRELERLQKEYGMTFLIISHYGHLLETLPPEEVVVLKNGAIVIRGGIDVATTIQKEGFEAL